MVLMVVLLVVVVLSMMVLVAVLRGSGELLLHELETLEMAIITWLLHMWWRTLSSKVLRAGRHRPRLELAKVKALLVTLITS